MPPTLARFVPLVLFLLVPAGAWAETPAAKLTLVDPMKYPKTVVSAEVKVQGFPVPKDLAPAPAGTNVHLWLADVAQPSLPLEQGELSVEGRQFSWKVFPATAGSVHVTLPAGTYDLGVRGTGYQVRNYKLIVSTDGKETVNDQGPDARGYFSLTASRPLNPQAQSQWERYREARRQKTEPFVPTSPLQISDSHYGVSSGFPRPAERVPSSGRLRALVIPVEFDGTLGQEDPFPGLRVLTRATEDYFYDQSGGKLAIDFTIVPQWVHIHSTLESFHMGTGESQVTPAEIEPPSSYVEKILEATEGSIDYGGWDIVYLVPPKEVNWRKIATSAAISGPFATQSGVFNKLVSFTGLTLNHDAALIVVHETLHCLGLIDEDIGHRIPTIGWGPMAAGGVDILAWDRYLLGWLDDSSIKTLDRASLDPRGTKVTLSPLSRKEPGVKAAMMPLGPTKVLVFESERRNAVNEVRDQWEGLLVYTVDSTKGGLEGGYEQLHRETSDGQHPFEQLYRAGNSAAAEGLAWEVSSADANGDTVTIFPQASFPGLLPTVEPIQPQPGLPWIVTETGAILRRQANAWVPVPGNAKGIAAGIHQDLWVIGPQGEPQKWNETGWDRYPGTSRRLAVDPDGEVFSIDPQGRLWFHTGFPYRGLWSDKKVTASDIAIGPGIRPWRLGTEPVDGGFSIYDENLHWDLEEGAGERLALDQEGNPWIVNQSGLIFRGSPGEDGNLVWNQVAGATARAIAVGSDNSVWILKRDQVPGGSSIAQLTDKGWQTVEGGAVDIAVP